MGASKVVEQNRSLSPGSCDADKLAFSNVWPVDVLVDTKADFGKILLIRVIFRPHQNNLLIICITEVGYQNKALVLRVILLLFYQLFLLSLLSYLSYLKES